jgi:hypothetical protein
MEEKIEKIIILVENSDVVDSTKKMWLVALDELKKVKFPEEYDIDNVLEAVYLDAQRDINTIGTFFEKIGSFIYAYVKGGDQALGENIDRSIEELDRKIGQLD